MMIPVRSSHLLTQIRRTVRALVTSHDLANAMTGLATVRARPDEVIYQPERIKIETTTRCNLACVFCGHTWGTANGLGLATLPEGEDEEAFVHACRHNGRDLNLDAFLRIIGQFPRMSHLDLQGMGEPLMNPNFIPMLEIAASRNASVQFFTNGMLMTPRVSKALVVLPVSQVSVSLDGASAATYESIRRGAQFGQVVANVAELVAARRREASRTPCIRLAMVVTRNNADEMPALVSLAHTLGVDEVVATQLKCIAPELSSWCCPDGIIVDAASEASRRARTFGLPFALEFALPHTTKGQAGSTPAKPKRCLWPWMSLNITIEGDVTPCAYVSRANGWNLGNIFETPFAKIWNGPGYRELRRRTRQMDLEGLPCAHCRDL